MRGSLPHLGECSFIAADSYGSLSRQLADENPRPSCHYQCCRGPQLLIAASRGELGIPENLSFCDVLTAEQCSGKLNHQRLFGAKEGEGERERIPSIISVKWDE